FYATASDGRTTVADPTGAPFDRYAIGICKGDPPICQVPDDLTIFQCVPEQVCLPVGCLDVTGARTGDPTLISGPGAIIDGEWCYTPSGNETVGVTVQCTDTCGQTCEGSFTVTFDMNDAPVCNATSSTGSPLCVPPVHIVTFETSDADDNLADCVVYGDGELIDHSWQIISPVPGQSVSARVVCYDECRDSCWIDINFTFPNPVPPVCDIPNDTTIVLCEIEIDSLPVSATAGAVCEIIDGLGELRNGYWVYEPTGSEQISVTIECRTECDTCGGTFRVTYEVNQPPVLTCQGSSRVECSDDLPLIDPLPPQIDDEDPASVVLSPPVFDTIPGDCENRFTVKITWIATDECGAADTCTDVIDVVDTGDPYFVDCPADTMYRECGAVGTLPPPQALDDCDSDVEVTIIDGYVIPGDCPQSFISVTTWEARDNCGNTATCQHIYKHVDQTPPVIDCPEPVAYDCDDVPTDFPPPPATDFDPTGTMICDPNPVVTEINRASSTTAECPQGYHLTIMWEAMDACGNADTCTQVIDVVDTTPPEMSCGVDTSIVSCGTDVFPAPPDATDNCDPAPVVTMGNAVRTPDPDCPYGWFMVVPWEATDACGNVAACTTYFKAVDDLPPTITCPPPSSQYCGPNTPPIPEPTVSDNCDLDPTVWLERIDTIDGSCPQAYTAHLIWMAEDDCGNVDSCPQVIEYYDDQPPDCDGHPPLVYSCDNVPDVFPLPLALDACDPDPLVLLVDRDSTGDACSYTLSLEYEYRDACGNSSFHTQFVEVSDTTRPHGITPQVV
ncbi:MAG TPA: hypothetical protein VM118_12930, partial [Acidobacteriota bacterium]|nr:hypothetical protein [Acidobacteriota bacterium]